MYRLSMKEKCIQKCQDILYENVKPSIHDLKHNRVWVMQQSNNTKQTSKSVKEWMKKIHVLEWLS